MRPADRRYIVEGLRKALPGWHFWGGSACGAIMAKRGPLRVLIDCQTRKVWSSESRENICEGLTGHGWRDRAIAALVAEARRIEE